MEDGQDWSCPFHTTPMSCIRMHAMRLDSQARVRTLSAVITVLIISYTRQHTTPCNSCPLHHTTPHGHSSQESSPSIPTPDCHTEVTNLPLLHAFGLCLLELLFATLFRRGRHLQQVPRDANHILKVLFQLEQLLIARVVREGSHYLQQQPRGSDRLKWTLTIEAYSPGVKN